MAVMPTGVAGALRAAIASGCVRRGRTLNGGGGPSPPRKTRKGGSPMITRRSFLQSGAAAAAFAASAGSARAANTPGVTDTEIKIGQTMPYSGPASAYGVIGRTETAYFKMINEQGGDQRPQDQSDQPRRRLQPAQDGRAGAPPRRAGAGRVPVQHARHRAEPRDPAISQRQQGAAAVRRDRRSDVRRPEAFPLDDRLQSELPDRGAHLRQAHSGDEAGRARSRSSIRTTASARTT